MVICRALLGVVDLSFSIRGQVTQLLCSLQPFLTLSETLEAKGCPWNFPRVYRQFQGCRETSVNTVGPGLGKGEGSSECCM